MERHRHTRQDSDTRLDITAEIKTIVAEITEAPQENDSDFVDELTEKRIDLINNLESNKYEAIADLIKNCENTARVLNQIARTLRERVVQHMKQLDVLTVDAGRFTVTRKPNSGKVKIDANVSIAELPERFQRITANKPELRRALRNGEKVEGVELETGEHIIINPVIRDSQ